MANNDATSRDSDSIRRITARDLQAAMPGTSTRWWERRLPALRRAGILSRIGQVHFGNMAEVVAWVRAGGDDAEDERATAAAGMLNTVDRSVGGRR